MGTSLSFVRSLAKLIWRTAAAITALLGASLAYAECATNSFIADDSISVLITSIDDSEATTKLAWLLDQGLEQLLHSRLIVVASSEAHADSEQQECPNSAYRLTGGVQADGGFARVTFQLVDAANSDVTWMTSFDRNVGGDLKAVADELASLAADDVIKIVSGKIE